MIKAKNYCSITDLKRTVPVGLKWRESHLPIIVLPGGRCLWNVVLSRRVLAQLSIPFGDQAWMLLPVGAMGAVYYVVFGGRA